MAIRTQLDSRLEDIKFSAEVRASIAKDCKHDPALLKQLTGVLDGLLNELMGPRPPSILQSVGVGKES